jgi:hypothetical protein
MTEITMTPVVSDTIDSYHYSAEYRTLLVHFKSGGVYAYRDCPPELAARLDKRHPWRRIHAEVKALPFERVSKGIKTGPRVVKKKRPASKSVTAKVRGLQQ